MFALTVPSLGAALLFVLGVIVAAVLGNIIETNLALGDWAKKLIRLVVVVVAIAFAARLFGVL